MGKEKELLLGAEVIAVAAIDEGISGVYAYPGTPSTEITTYIQQSEIAQQKKIRQVKGSEQTTRFQ